MYFPLSNSSITDYRLGLALLLSVLLHTAVLLGIGRFDFFTPLTKSEPPELEIILIPEKKEELTQKPDFLAQAETAGEEEIEKKVPPPPKSSSPPHSPSSQAQPKLADGASITHPTVPKVKTKSLPPKTEPSTTREATSPQGLSQEQGLSQDKVTPPAPKATPHEDSEESPPKPRPSAQELIAALEGQLAKEIQRYAKQPRKRYIDSSTKEYAATAYLDAWRKKIERVGKMNYPEEAKRRDLSGSLILVVDLEPDGTVANIVVRRSSGYKILDKAAIRIVHLAAPFAKVPENLLQGHDILSITRTWQFRSGKDFSAH